MSSEAVAIKQVSPEERVLDLTADRCRTRFESFSKITNVTLKPCSLSSVGFEINRRSEIFLYGVDITMRFQAFYSDVSFKKHIQGIFQDPTTEQVHDFFNELGNLTLGKMKEVFIANKVNVAISLPVSVSTSKARILESPHILTNVALWRIEKEGQTLCYIYASAEIHKPEALDNFDENAGGQNDSDGEIELF